MFLVTCVIRNNDHFEYPSENPFHTKRVFFFYGVCRGSGFSFSRAYYRSLSWNFNDTHGIGIVMLAGVEYLRLSSDRG